MAVAAHAGSTIAPRSPAVVVTFAPAKLAVRKLASGSGLQRVASHFEGASTIHSAAVTSTRFAVSCLAKTAPVVRSARRSLTVRPDTATLAESVSPGRTRRAMDTGPAGTSSYHAE